MKDKTQRPDRAHHDEPNVPTYSADASEQDPETTVYQRAGRAAPQEIRPQSQSDAATTAFQAQDRHDEAASETAYTERIPREPYRDQDFAATSSVPAGTVPASQAAYLNEPAAVPASELEYEDLEHDAVYAEPEKADARRGTIDLGLLIARLLLGVVLTIGALATFFQLGGNPGLAGLENEFAGYPWARILSIVIPTAQLAAGVFLIFGLLTPVAAAVATVATGFTALHALASSGQGLNVFAWPESVWLSIVLLGLSVALQFTGPGLYSLDFGRSWARRPLASSWLFIVLALVGAGALWWFGTGINPFA
ncbi:DoxX family protein [Corynebacterium tapiri]|uniref:DoxX family protein n=1 Tax=Corynebacterium tapiri TaxID=1448266 RepID=A0A5C4U6P7_9CORY|nr:DoxX family protein [Corynebacterium tapiri]TNL99782.1 DoxX family protein [Corynebacterium tapiri]